MELRHCRYFLAAYETGNFTRAAAQLGISQPSLSQQIAQLEENLGVRLFDRRGRGIQPTSAGEIFLPHARRLLQAVENARLEVANGQSLNGGKFRVGCIPTLQHFCSAAIAEFMRQFPDAKVEVREGTRQDIDRLLLSGEVELGIAGLVGAIPHIAGQVVFEEPYVLAFRKEHPLAGRKINKLNEIGNAPFGRFSNGSFSRHVTDKYLSRIRFTPNVCLETECVENLLDVLAKTDLCAILPKSTVLRRQLIAFQELAKPAPVRVVAVLTSQGCVPSPAAQKFTAFLVEYANELQI